MEGAHFSKGFAAKLQEFVKAFSGEEFAQAFGLSTQMFIFSGFSSHVFLPRGPDPRLAVVSLLV